MRNIAVLAATSGELSRLAESFHAVPEPARLPWDVSTARLGSTRIIFTVTGVGIANAAAATAVVSHVYAPDLCIATGCAGAYPGSGLEIGDLALATTEVFVDTGVATPEGWRDLRYMELPLVDRHGIRLFNDIPLSPRAADQALHTARRNGISLHRGAFLTVSTCSGALSRGNELSARFNGICENMEGAAVALTATRFGVDCLEIRAISNHVEDRDISRWDIPRAAAVAGDFLERLIRDL
jgi:futalosine hydrolase